MTDVVKLQEIIRTRGVRKSWIAEQLGITSQAFIYKLEGKNEFKGSEIIKISKALMLDRNQVSEIFLGGM